MVTIRKSYIWTGPEPAPDEPPYKPTPEYKAYVRQWSKKTAAEINALLKNPKFLNWKPTKSKRVAGSVLDEKCYSPSEIGSSWGWDAETVVKIFENEPDVLIHGDEQGTKHKRRYRTMAIPESVVIRVKNRLGSRAAKISRGSR
jgi:hypothetical protein